MDQVGGNPDFNGSGAITAAPMGDSLRGHTKESDKGIMLRYRFKQDSTVRDLSYSLDSKVAVTELRTPLAESKVQSGFDPSRL